MLQVNAIRAFRDNYIWLIVGRDGRSGVIVDPGDADPVLSALSELRVEPVAVLVTHHHSDHVGGISGLREHYPDLAVYGPAREAIPGLTVPCAEGDRVNLAAVGARFAVMEVPGHTAGHIAFLGGGALFCGDTLFACGCGRLFEGTAEQMSASLGRIARLRPDTLVYCAHEYTEDNIGFALWVEPRNAALLERQRETRALRSRGETSVPSRLSLELETNPFLRVGEPAVIEAAGRYAQRELSGSVEIFGVLRAWKDREYD